MTMSNSRRLCITLSSFLLLGLPVHLAAQNEPLTIAESSDYAATSRFADVIDFINELQRQSPLIRVETLCTSAEGRKVPLLVIGDPPPSSPAELKNDEREVVYIQANIHAGEVEGKEAALMLARDILRGKTPPYLEKLVILIAPIFNADGNEKISPDNRRRQVGPKQGVGIRYNGQNLDLNRDGMKLESPEVLGLVRHVLVRWDPMLFLDSHTHNGSYHQEPVTWTWGLNPNGDTTLLDYMADTMMPAVNKRMKAQYNILCLPHGDFMDVRNPETGWVPLGPQPRYLSNYAGLRNRLSILNEQYPYVDFKGRVHGCYSLFLSVLDHCRTNRDEIADMLKEADRKTVARGLNPTADDGFIVEYGREPIRDRFTILGYEMEITETAGRRPQVKPTDTKKTYFNVPYYARYTKKRAVQFPHAYLITVPDMAIIEKLRQHGIMVEQLTEPASLTVESFTVTEITPADRINQGHYTNSIKGECSILDKDFPAGTFFVSMAQPLANVAAYLLEPESDDGLIVWNYFDRYLGLQWSSGPRTYPVYKLYQPANLVKDTIGSPIEP
jgi:hypothetical protein